MTDLPKFADLEAMAAALGPIPQRAKLDNILKRLKRTQSCIADLSLAQHSCEALSQLGSIHTAMPPVHRTAVEHALTANAIVLYARATSTNSNKGERGSVSINDRLSKEDKPDHEMILDLRDKVIAHVHPGEEVADSIWHHEKVFAVEDGQGWIPAAGTRRVQTEPATAKRLRKMIPLAQAILRVTYDRQIAALVDVLHQIGVEQSLFESHPLDPTTIFGSVEEARRSFQNRHRGQSSGVITNPE